MPKTSFGLWIFSIRDYPGIITINSKCFRLLHYNPGDVRILEIHVEYLTGRHLVSCLSRHLHCPTFPARISL
jgi:hypothetical protein